MDKYHQIESIGQGAFGYVIFVFFAVKFDGWSSFYKFF